MVIDLLLPGDWNRLAGFITDCKSIGALKKKVLRHICLNLLLIGCNLFPRIFVMQSALERLTGLDAI